LTVELVGASLTAETIGKFKELKNYLKSLGSVLVAYSGGVDSTFLFKVAHEVLGDKCMGVTASSETYPQSELAEALKVAENIGGKHMLIRTEELADERFAGNPVNRCYFCKAELFSKLWSIARRAGLNYVVDGANADDVHDYRPGHQAGQELGVKSPLQEVGLSKEEIRQLSKALGLPTWNKPSFACLSSRFPYGQRITSEKLAQVDQAETFLRQLGFGQLRVRHHENIARIEVPREDFPLVTGAMLDRIVAKLKDLGFVYVTLDLQGLRSGSMNEVLFTVNSQGPHTATTKPQYN